MQFQDDSISDCYTQCDSQDTYMNLTRRSKKTLTLAPSRRNLIKRIQIEKKINKLLKLRLKKILLQRKTEQKGEQ